MNFARRIEKLLPYLFAEISRRVAEKRSQGVDVISFGIGDADLPTPDHLLDSLVEASRDPAKDHYPETEGLPELLEAIAQHNESAPEPIRVRVGLNAGEPIAEQEDLFGTAVNLAARIAAKAEVSEILTPDTVRGLVAGKRFLFADRGETSLRGFEDPVRLFEVSWRDEG